MEGPTLFLFLFPQPLWGKRGKKKSGEKLVYFKNTRNSFPGIDMFSSLILNFQAVERCLGEILSSALCLWLEHDPSCPNVDSDTRDQKEG